MSKPSDEDYLSILRVASKNLSYETFRLFLEGLISSESPQLHITASARVVPQFEAIKRLQRKDPTSYALHVARACALVLGERGADEIAREYESGRTVTSVEISKEVWKLGETILSLNQKLKQGTTKKIVICCDGTWNAPEKLDPTVRVATNVLQLSRAVLPRDKQGRPQVVEYVRGIGTQNILDRVNGGISGKGISSNILQAYQFLSNNYERGDQLFLFGFSRGAYTARSLSGFINLLGILRKENLHALPNIYRDYQRSPRTELGAVKERYGHMTNRELEDPEVGFIPIHLLGVWDTVGALGVPLLRPIYRKRIQFHDTDLAPNVSHAYHALAIHEFRKDFSPTLWTQKLPRQIVEQVWFPGAHSDVGGGVDQQGLPSIALHWMVSRAAKAGLEFNNAFLQAFIPDASVPVSNSRTGIFRLSRPKIRGMGSANPKSGQQGIEQFRHRSVTERLDGMPASLSEKRSSWEREVDELSLHAGLNDAPP